MYHLDRDCAVRSGQNMAPRSKDSRLRLLEPLAGDLTAFRLATGMGVTEIGIVRDAVRAFINSRVARDRGLRERYEAERAIMRAGQRQPIRLVKAEPGSGA